MAGSERQPSPERATTGGVERRMHARAVVNCEISIAGSLGSGNATLRDISMGGAGLTTGQPIAAPGEVIVLRVPGRGGPIEVQAEVLRTGQHERDGQFLAVRFHAASEQALEQLIGALLEKHRDRRRRDLRVSRRVKLRMADGEHGGLVLENISRGGLAMTAQRGFELGALVRIEIPDLTGATSLILGVQVVHQRLGWRGSTAVFHVGVEFLPLTPVERLTLDMLLAQYLRPKL